MIVDASALVALLFDEPGSEAIADVLAQNAGHLSMSPVIYLGAAVWLDRLKSADKSAKSVLPVETLRLEISGTTPKQATTLAREAYQQFSKGNRPARLNLGNCFAYALAKVQGEPLPFKGDNFRRTDVEAVL